MRNGCAKDWEWLRIVEKIEHNGEEEVSNVDEQTKRCRINP